MELQLEQQMISCLIPCVNRSVEERFSTDFVVPDSLPDAAELLLAEGDLCIWRLDLSGGNAELEGEIAARISFTDEHGSPESFPVSVPVQLRVRDDAIASGQRPFLRCRVKTINAHLLNSRKVRVQGAVQCVLVTYGASEIAVTTGFAPCEQNIYERKAQIRIPYISAVEEQVITTEERLPLQHDMGKIYLPVQFHFLLGDGDGGGHIFLGQGCTAAQDKERGNQCDQSFHLAIIL